ncbi:MAG: DUF167 domain-containing protein [Thermoplasmata archaeon]
MARLSIRVRAGASRDELSWDPWRACWVVSCREPALGGRANRAVAGLMAGWLGSSPGGVRWERAGASRDKVLVADGLSEVEATERLELHCTTERPKPRRPPGSVPPQGDPTRSSRPR